VFYPEKHQCSKITCNWFHENLWYTAYRSTSTILLLSKITLLHRTWQRVQEFGLTNFQIVKPTNNEHIIKSAILQVQSPVMALMEPKHYKTRQILPRNYCLYLKIRWHKYAQLKKQQNKVHNKWQPTNLQSIYLFTRVNRRTLSYNRIKQCVEHWLQ
jgi:hypothetical protein